MVQVLFGDAPVFTPGEIVVIWYISAALLFLAVMAVALVIRECIGEWNGPPARNPNSPWYGTANKRSMPRNGTPARLRRSVFQGTHPATRA